MASSPIATPGEVLYDNLTIAANVMEAARRVGVEKLVLLGSSCVYPKFAPQPITEHTLLTGSIEPTKAAVRSRFHRAAAEQPLLAGRHFDSESSHVIAALTESEVAATGFLEDASRLGTRHSRVSSGGRVERAAAQAKRGLSELGTTLKSCGTMAGRA